MIFVADGLYDLGLGHDLIYSPNDGGWYIQHHERVSITYSSKDTAYSAFRSKTIEWES